MKRQHTWLTLLAFGSCLYVGSVYASELPVLEKTTDPGLINSDITLDTRPLSSCLQQTVAGAICLPIEDFVAPQRRLANWSGILWLLGTAQLTGNEHVLIVGEKSDRRDLLAGVLALAGQKQITTVDKPVSKIIGNTDNTSAGTQRSTTRVNVFAAPMRSDLIALGNEMINLYSENTIILDGRSEAEYFGQRIRAARGGHIPGAIHYPISQLTDRASQHAVSSTHTVAYAHDSVEGLVYFSTLLANGINTRLFLGGWTEWAADGALPADAASFPLDVERHIESTSAQLPVSTSRIDFQANRLWFTLAALIMISLMTLSFFMGKLLYGRHR